MAKDPAFPLYAQDFIVGTMHLSMELRGQYITLLAYQWNNSDEIPKKRLGLLIGCSWDDLAVDLKEKFEDLGESIVNARLLEEREKRENFKKKQSDNGRKGGRPKKTLKPNKKPIENQNKPLEDEDVSEEEIENKDVSEEEGLDFSEFDNPEKAKSLWEGWLKYRKQEHGFRYKSELTMKTAISGMSRLSDGRTEKLKDLMTRSIENGWKGLFPERESKQNNGSDRKTQLAKLASELFAG